MLPASTRAALARFTDTFQWKILTVAIGVGYLVITNEKRQRAASTEVADVSTKEKS